MSDRPAFCTFDQAHRFLTVNDTMLWILRKRRDELVGSKLLDVFPQVLPLDELLQKAQRTLAVQKGRQFSPSSSGLLNTRSTRLGTSYRSASPPGWRSSVASAASAASDLLQPR